MNTKHWNLIQNFALAALLPLFAACSSEGDELLQGEEKQPVQVNMRRRRTAARRGKTACAGEHYTRHYE